MQMSAPTPKHVFTNVVQYIMCLKVLCYVWAKVGASKVNSKTAPGATVRQFPFELAVRYPGWVLRKSGEAPVGQALAWTMKTEQLTRSRRVAQQLRGHPAGEALESALADTRVDWDMILIASGGFQSTTSTATLEEQLFQSPEPKRPRTEVADKGQARVGEAAKAGKGDGGGLQPKDGGRTVTTLRGNKKVCKPYNDARGCSHAKPGKESKEGWHLGDRILASGKSCGEPHVRCNG